MYRQVQAHDVATLSYMNVFEFGMNVRGHANGAAVPAKPDDYRNATLYAQNHLSGIRVISTHQLTCAHKPICLPPGYILPPVLTCHWPQHSPRSQPTSHLTNILTG